MKKITYALAALPVAALLAGCGSSVKIPDPTPQDYAWQAAIAAAHPSMNCYLTWQGFSPV